MSDSPQRVPSDSEPGHAVNQAEAFDVHGRPMLLIGAVAIGGSAAAEIVGQLADSGTAEYWGWRGLAAGAIVFAGGAAWEIITSIASSSEHVRRTRASRQASAGEDPVKRLAKRRKSDKIAS